MVINLTYNESDPALTAKYKWEWGQMNEWLHIDGWYDLRGCWFNVIVYINIMMDEC